MALDVVDDFGASKVVRSESWTKNEMSNRLNVGYSLTMTTSKNLSVRARATRVSSSDLEKCDRIDWTRSLEDKKSIANNNNFEPALIILVKQRPECHRDIVGMGRTNQDALKGNDLKNDLTYLSY